MPVISVEMDGILIVGERLVCREHHTEAPSVGARQPVRGKPEPRYPVL